MSFRRLISGLVVFAALALLWTGAGDSWCLAAQVSKPNLVLFLSDDHGYADTSVAGSAAFRTPNLARLARDGMTFTHAFAASPTCAPSRAAVLTGLMPARNGAMLNHQAPRRDVKKLPAYLRELGYEIVAFGKVAHYKQGADYGFDHVSHDGFHEDDCIDAALEFMKARKSDKPLCLLVGTNCPHVPWPEAGDDVNADQFVPPRTHVDTRETRRWRARYAAAVQRADDDLGRVYTAAFEKLGDDTVFLHFSDHGAQWPLGKWNLYDAGTRVPFFVVWPSVVRAGSESAAMLSLIDVLPTLIEIAGGAPPAVDGQSFADVLVGRQEELREAVFATHSGDGRMNRYPMRSVRTRRWKYIRNLLPEARHTTHIDQGQAIDGNAYWISWKEKANTDRQAAAIVDRYHRRPAEELYDMQSDPLEQHDLSYDERHAGTLAQLRSQLDEWMRRQGDRGLATERAIQFELVPAPPAGR